MFVLLRKPNFLFVEQVQKCIKALEVAETDMERFATLFLIPKLIRGCDCDKNARISLMKVSNALEFDLKSKQFYQLPIRFYLGNWLLVSGTNVKKQRQSGRLPKIVVPIGGSISFELFQPR